MLLWRIIGSHNTETVVGDGSVTWPAQYSMLGVVRYRNTSKCEPSCFSDFELHLTVLQDSNTSIGSNGAKGMLVLLPSVEVSGTDSVNRITPTISYRRLPLYMYNTPILPQYSPSWPRICASIDSLTTLRILIRR